MVSCSDLEHFEWTHATNLDYNWQTQGGAARNQIGKHIIKWEREIVKRNVTFVSVNIDYDHCNLNIGEYWNSRSTDNFNTPNHIWCRLLHRPSLCCMLKVWSGTQWSRYLTVRVFVLDSKFVSGTNRNVFPVSWKSGRCSQRLVYCHSLLYPDWCQFMF